MSALNRSSARWRRRSRMGRTVSVRPGSSRGGRSSIPTMSFTDRPDEPLDDVLQLADVPGPAVGLERAQRLLGEGDLPLRPRELMLDERADVLGPLAQRGHADVHHVEAVHQVFAELAGRDGGHDVLVGGRDHAHVDLRPHRFGADGLNLAVLEEAQEHRLHAQAHLGHFVQEDRAVVRLLQHADLVAERVRERALHVAEQLRLEQRLRDAGAVDRHERLPGAAGVGVDELGDEVLADAALAGDQHLGVAGGHPLGEAADRLDRGAPADDDRPGEASGLICSDVGGYCLVAIRSRRGPVHLSVGRPATRR